MSEAVLSTRQDDADDATFVAPAAPPSPPPPPPRPPPGEDACLDGDVVAIHFTDPTHTRDAISEVLAAVHHASVTC